MSHPLANVERFCLLLVAALAAYTYTTAARADGYTGHPTWRRIVVAEDVKIETHTVSLSELIAMQDQKRDVRNVRGTQHRGLAKLYQNTVTGDWTCHVYVPAAASRDTLTHEFKHCHGWVHE